MPQQKAIVKAQPLPPLADRLRPKRLDEIVGQDHLFGASGPLASLLEERGEDGGDFAAAAFGSLLFWGPPGSGKTSIARLLAERAGLYFEQISAIFSGVAELKKIFASALERRQKGEGTLLFVDEIHRFNRTQQDSFLPYVEDGTVTLVGATTENPSFEINGALLSRLRVLVLKPHDEASLEQLLKRAERVMEKSLPLEAAARTSLLQMADGDGRYILGACEAIWSWAEREARKRKAEYLPNIAEAVTPSPAPLLMDQAMLAKFLARRPPLYDKSREGHYNLISALHKSLRGSDANAALYWFARMLTGGEDPLYIVRRLIRFASEDIGLADPQALQQALLARTSYEQLGSPEGELAIAQAVLYLATAPKSNAAYKAFKKAMKMARDTGSVAPPAIILNAPTQLMKNLGYGDGYRYDHEEADGFSGQNYFPDTMARQNFYEPIERGFERDIKKRLDYWAKLRANKQKDM